MKNEKEIITICGIKYELIPLASQKFYDDLMTVKRIIEKDTLSADDRKTLLSVYNAAYHKSGKIEGITSFDSTSTNCAFCQMMREAAKNNPLHICGYCYDYDQEHGFKGANVLNRHTLNMVIMMSVEFSIDELVSVNASEINRVNSSGDVPNDTYARNMIKLCFAHSDRKFAFWAKNTAAVISACDALGKPKNVTLIQSSPIIGKPSKLAKYFDLVFTVYVTKEDTEAAIADGACECNGKKCKACGYKCYLNGWKAGSNIAEYLRVDKETRAKMLAK